MKEATFEYRSTLVQNTQTSHRNASLPSINLQSPYGDARAFGELDMCADDRHHDD